MYQEPSSNFENRSKISSCRYSELVCPQNPFLTFWPFSSTQINITNVYQKLNDLLSWALKKHVVRPKVYLSLSALAKSLGSNLRFVLFSFLVRLCSSDYKIHIKEQEKPKNFNRLPTKTLSPMKVTPFSLHPECRVLESYTKSGTREADA